MADRVHRGRSLKVEMRTRATPEAVWEAWADPEKIARWFVDRASGKPEVGTTFTFQRLSAALGDGPGAAS